MDEQQVIQLTENLSNAQETIKTLQQRIDELSVKNSEMLNELQQIVKNQDVLIDYFVPTEEELKEQQKQLKIQEEEQKKLDEELEMQLQLETEKEEQFRQNLIEEIGLVNEGINNVTFETSNMNVYMYLVCLGLIVVGVCTFIYKMIKKFTHY